MLYVARVMEDIVTLCKVNGGDRYFNVIWGECSECLTTLDLPPTPKSQWLVTFNAEKG